MKINNSYSTDVTPRSTRAVSDPATVDRTGSASAASGAAQTSPQDSVELSAEGLARAKDSTLSDQRIAQIRQNVLQGAYDSSHVVDQVAKKILSSGDI
jgi:negative regulator of flagellin synthesis FlgM